jgi:hypothetical protein
MRAICETLTAVRCTSRYNAPEHRRVLTADWKAFPNPNGVACDVSKEADLMGATPKPDTESGANMLATVQMLCRSHRAVGTDSSASVRPLGPLREGFIRQALGALCVLGGLLSGSRWL